MQPLASTEVERRSPPLDAVGKTLATNPDRLGFLRPSDPAEPLASLHARYAGDGYLWLKGFLPRAEVLAFRGLFFSWFADAGLLKPGTDPREGIASGEAGNADLARRRLMEFVRSAAYESFCLHRRIWQFLERFIDGPPYLHKRKLIRYTRPGDGASTPAHYDLVYLRGGTDRLVTVWIPIGDTPAAMGGLVYLEGSHALGKGMEADFARANADLPAEERISAYNRNMAEGGWISKDLPGMAEKFDARWLIADYEAGDIMLHSPYTIHAAPANRDPENRLRLSTDIRYQNVRDEIDARWNNHWTLGDML
jgi:ectoine hydroxylase-related dioxygenase (phytanoyl-CoA dioxygenase family)